MSTLITRLVHAHALATALRDQGGDATQAPKADLFARTVYLINEIEVAVINAGKEARMVRIGRSVKDVRVMQHASAELARLLAQATTLHGVLTRELEQHLAQQPSET